MAASGATWGHYAAMLSQALAEEESEDDSDYPRSKGILSRHGYYRPAKRLFRLVFVPCFQTMGLEKFLYGLWALLKLVSKMEKGKGN